MKAQLETNRLVLRDINACDLDKIHNCWMKDNEVSKYMWWHASNDIKDTIIFVEFELDNLNNPNWNRWIVVLKDTNMIIGTVLLYLNDEDEPNHYDISYNFGKNYWGYGYATEAISTVINYAKKGNITEIITSYASENKASANVLHKLGFKDIKDIPFECNLGIIPGKLCKLEVK